MYSVSGWNHTEVLNTYQNKQRYLAITEPTIIVMCTRVWWKLSGRLLKGNMKMYGIYIYKA